jgi:hypothetical protein
MIDKLPEWPTMLEVLEHFFDDAGHEVTAICELEFMAREKAAWESRCRLAAKDLERFSYFDTNCHGTSFLCTCVGHTARRTLKAIGPLPEKQP